MASSALARGGLAARLRPGRLGFWAADGVLADGAPTPTDAPWTSRLAARLPEAVRGLLLGVDVIVANPAEKAEPYRTTSRGFAKVDMESHVAARVAQRHRRPSLRRASSAIQRIACCRRPGASR